MKTCPSCGTNNFNMAEKCMSCNTSLIDVKPLSQHEEAKVAQNKEAEIEKKSIEVKAIKEEKIRPKKKSILLGINNGSLWAQILMFVYMISYIVLFAVSIYILVEIESVLLFFLCLAGLILYIAVTMISLEMFNNISRIRYESQKTNDLLEKILNKDN
jgi:hypothetical protein